MRKVEVNHEVMLKFLNKHSKKYKKILRIDKAGEGGQS